MAKKLMAELLGTFALVFAGTGAIVINDVTGGSISHVAFEALFAGPISGASMNPARSLAPALVAGRLDSLWVYLSAPVLGALLAVPACRCVQEKGCCSVAQETAC